MALEIYDTEKSDPVMHKHNLDASNAIPGRDIYMFMSNRDQIMFSYNLALAAHDAMPCSTSINAPVSSISSPDIFRVSSPCTILDLVLNLPWNDYTNAVGDVSSPSYERAYLTNYVVFGIYCNGISVDTGFVLHDILMGSQAPRRIIPTYEFLPGYDYQVRLEYRRSMACNPQPSNGCYFLKFETTAGAPYTLGFSPANFTSSDPIRGTWGYNSNPIKPNVSTTVTVPVQTTFLAARFYTDLVSPLVLCSASNQHYSITVHVNGVPTNVRIPLNGCLWNANDGIHFPLVFLPGNTYEFKMIADTSGSTDSW